MRRLDLAFQQYTLAMRLYPGTGEEWAGRAAQIGARVVGQAPLDQSFDGTAARLEDVEATRSGGVDQRGGCYFGLFVLEWPRVVWGFVPLFHGSRSIGRRRPQTLDSRWPRDVCGRRGFGIVRGARERPLEV